MQFNAIPFDLANKYPVVQQLIDIVHGAVPNGKLTTFTLSSMSAWLLWAKSAKACGSTLTVTCVLQKAQTESAWNAGGLYPKQDLRPGHIHAAGCIAIVKLTSQRLRLRREADPADRRQGALQLRPRQRQDREDLHPGAS